LLRRVATIGGFSLACGLGAAWYGAFEVPVDTHLGPHDATATLNNEANLIVDVGIGKVGIPLHDSHGLGATVVVKEIPANTSIPESSPEQPKAPLEQAVEAYAALAAGPEHDARQIQQDLQEHITDWFWNGMGFGGMIGLGTYMALGAKLRHELSDRCHTLAGPMLAGAVTITGTGTVAIDTNGHHKSPRVPVTDPRLQTGVLKGSWVTGELFRQGVEKFGPEAIETIEQNDEFYKIRLIQAFDKAFAKLGYDPTNDPTKRILFDTDNHCQISMPEVLRYVDEAFKTNLRMNAGDITFSGSAPEFFCVDRFTLSFNGKEVLVSAGNHDSSITEQQLGHKGVIVLNGGAVEAQGLRVGGDGDVDRSGFGSGTHQQGSETVEDQSERLADVTCDDEEGVDILMTHDPKALRDALEQGCMDTGLAGHLHERRAVMVELLSGKHIPLIIGGSAGGAKENSISVYGPLQNEASVLILRQDPDTNKFLGYHEVIFNPEGTNPDELVAINYVSASDMPVVPIKDIQW
jgi:predicted phosphodiesterase